MNVTREDVLRELELLPVWRLRSPVLIVEPIYAPTEALAVEVLTLTPKTEIIEPQTEIIELKGETAETAQLVTEMVQPELLPTMRLLVSEDANWLFILESMAGNTESETLLQNMLRAISVKISADTGINISQVKAAQLAEYQTKIIIVFGIVAAQVLLGNNVSFDVLRLNQHQQPLIMGNNMPVIVTYHPTELLQRLPNKAKAWDDLRLAMQVIQRN